MERVGSIWSNGFSSSRKLIRQSRPNNEPAHRGMGGSGLMYLAGASAIGVGTANYQSLMPVSDIIGAFTKSHGQIWHWQFESLRQEVKASLR